MSRFTDKKLALNGQDKYLVSVSFTFAEISELRRTVADGLKMQNYIKRDRSKTADEHEKAGYRSQQLQLILRGVTEAFRHIKKATNARQEGRYIAEQHRQQIEPELEGF